MTYQNLGFWIGQANDTSTGRHPTGWTNGQRWSETAGEWTTMYDTSQSALASMTTDRDTWHTRADQAYGPGRTWNSAPSFEDQAWTGSGYGSGVLWSDAAHDDPNVWTNRYNAGYSQATTDKQPAALWDGASAQGTGGGAANWNTYADAGSTLTVPYAGYYVVSAEAQLSNNNHSDDTDYIGIRVVAGASTVLFTSPNQGKSKQPPGSYRSFHYVMGVAQLAANTVLKCQIISFSQGSDPNCTFSGIFVRARFIPTPAQPH